jgi:PadR family transcriptional regulator PadR
VRANGRPGKAPPAPTCVSYVEHYVIYVDYDTSRDPLGPIMTLLRMTHPTALILSALASGYRYGFDIMDATGLPSGTVYPALRRLEGSRLVRSSWESAREAHGAGRPRRRLYELTGAGRKAAVEGAARLADTRRFLGPAPDGERA